MKAIAFVAGALLGALVVFLLVPRYQLIETRTALGSYVLRVDRWTGRTDYWTADQSLWRKVERDD